jgi:hypothetical protein
LFGELVNVGEWVTITGKPMSLYSAVEQDEVDVSRLDSRGGIDRKGGIPLRVNRGRLDGYFAGK